MTSTVPSHMMHAGMLLIMHRCSGLQNVRVLTVCFGQLFFQHIALAMALICKHALLRRRVFILKIASCFLAQCFLWNNLENTRIICYIAIKATRSVTAKENTDCFYYQILSINMCFANNKSKQYQKWLNTVFTRAGFTADLQFPINCLPRQ